MTAFHLAQLNIGRLLAPLDSEQMSSFVAALEPINALADSAPGFVWRLQTEAGDATALRVFDDDMLIVNMSVWESREALSQFVFRSAHREVLTGRRQWFERIDDDYLVLWWVAAGHIPEVDEAKARLSLLQKEGPSPEAFTFRSVFPAPDATP
ncbi:MAG TPA: DUF3291 domain-containing protein [Acidimicrobiales bacterium]|nr:DUF3291 domain-containing protein [Acidimicrobiales bacterium]